MGPESVLNLQKLNTDSFVCDQMWRRFRTLLCGTKMGPKSVLNLQNINTDSFVFGQMWRGFRTLFWNKTRIHTFSESSEA